VSEVESTLHGSSGRESPARTALSLILDVGDGSLGSPINRSREVNQLRARGRRSVVLRRIGWLVSVQLGLHLILRQIGVRVDAQLGALGGISVVGHYTFISQLEVVITGEQLISSVLLVELSHKLGELRSVLTLADEHSRGA
jgi:hypothetical protein